MYRSYITKTADGRLCAFYHTAENGLCRRAYENGRWGRGLSLAMDAASGFSVLADAEGGFLITYRDREGLLRLCAGAADGSVVSRRVLAGPGEINGAFHLLTAGRDFAKDRELTARLLYEAEDEDGGTRLFCRLLEGEGMSEQVAFASHLPLFETGFLAQAVKGDHTVLLYQSAGPEPRLGYREISAAAEGEFRPVHISPGHAAAATFLVSSDAIHFLYVVRTMFSYRLVYRKKHAAGLTSAVNVCDAARMDGCLLFIVRNRLNACYMSGGRLYVCESTDDGQSFRRPKRYTAKLCEMPMKAAFLPPGQPDESELCVRELLVDSQNPWDVQVLPDAYEDFYCGPRTANTSTGADYANTPTGAASANTPTSAVSANTPTGADYANTPAVTADSGGGHAAPSKPGAKPRWDMEAEMYYGADVSEAEKLRNQMEMLERRLAEKDRQLLAMAALRREVETQKAVIERLYKERSGQEQERADG